MNEDLCARWKVIADTIIGATTLLFPHKYTALPSTPQSTCTYLHVFADTSLKAYGAVAFIQQDNSILALVMSNARVAPLKQLTFPSLELKAAVLAVIPYQDIPEPCVALVRQPDCPTLDR